MTHEEKQLLIIDLCARLPYNFVYCYCNAPLATGKPIILTPVVISNLMNASEDLVIKPYLRPMSSMTEEEKIELKTITKGVIQTIGLKNIVVTTDKGFDWLNKKGFDYRGLIPMGLALEALEDMYKTE